MKIRKALPADVETMLEIYVQARATMRNSGNFLQWNDNYPSIEIIETDMAAGNSYVCTDDSGAIVATFCFMLANEPTYTNIYNGKWLNNKPYGVMHRLAGNGKAKGVGAYCIEWCYKHCFNLRIDTHHDNCIMLSILKKNGFTECGIIHIYDGSPRIAFQKCRE